MGVGGQKYRELLYIGCYNDFEIYWNILIQHLEFLPYSKHPLLLLEFPN